MSQHVYSPEQQIQKISTKVVGVTFGTRQAIIQQLSVGAAVCLRREPGSIYDPNAIRVERNHGRDRLANRGSLKDGFFGHRLLTLGLRHAIPIGPRDLSLVDQGTCVLGGGDLYFEEEPSLRLVVYWTAGLIGFNLKSAGL